MSFHCTVYYSFDSIEVNFVDYTIALMCCKKVTIRADEVITSSCVSICTYVCVSISSIPELPRSSGVFLLNDDNTHDVCAVQKTKEKYKLDAIFNVL